MNKKKKPKAENNFNEVNSSEGLKQIIFKNYTKEMEKESKEFAIKNPNLMDSKFYLFQTIQNKDSVRDMIFNLAYFYDTGYTGNKDFMHVPNIKNILDNALKYPIILATQKDVNKEEQILGVSTIKIENTKSISDYPYFPTVGETILTITGVLANQNIFDNKNNKIKGIGKELIKSSIRAAYNVNKQTKVRLVAEIDCRNLHSFDAFKNVVTELKQENLDVNINIAGYYEVINSQGRIEEAPTFMLEIDLGENRTKVNDKIEFNYLNCRTTKLFLDLKNTIRKNTKEIKSYINKKDDKMIIYHDLEAINALNVYINAGNTASGNDRVPVIKEIEYIQQDLI